MSTLIDAQQAQKNHQARGAALAGLTGLGVESTSLVQFASRGHVLVIGGMDAMELAPRLSEHLHPTMLLTEGAEEPGVPVVHLGGRAMRIEGHLGNFKVTLGEAGKPNAETLNTDLILDLSTKPLLDMPLPPTGYVHSSTEENVVGLAIANLSDMVGTFEKPTYFEYEASKCAHSRNSRTACTLCLDACPAQAIISVGDNIEVNPNLCQGGGICATVCPSGAIRYTYPRAKDTLERIRLLLNSYREQGGEQPVLAFFSESEFAESDGPLPELQASNVLPIVLEELASAGLEIWLSALAYGAQRLLLVDGGSMPSSVGESLALQIETTKDILKAMGYAAGAIELVRPAEIAQAASGAMSLAKNANFTTQNNKRETAYMAIDHLHAQAERAKPMALLSVGAPFGNAQVDEVACTLCMACVSACPGKALQHGQDSPMLKFVEANCVQCGMCTRTCPEDAITISPRLLFNPEERRSPRVLKEEEPFNCIVCGKPFATRSVITSMLTKLQGHAMFQSERAQRRLSMCEDCRVADVVQDPEAMEGDLNLSAKPDGQLRQ